LNKKSALSSFLKRKKQKGQAFLSNFLVVGTTPHPEILSELK